MANASVAIEVSTLGTSKTLQDLKGVELSTSKMVANLKNAKIDLGIKKQFEDANREAQRFQQQNMRLAAQIGGRALFAYGLKELGNFGELAEPLKRSLEMMTDIGLQMMATRSAMKEMSQINPLQNASQLGVIGSNIAGGAIAGSLISGSLNPNNPTANNNIPKKDLPVFAKSTLPQLNIQNMARIENDIIQKQFAERAKTKFGDNLKITDQGQFTTKDNKVSPIIRQQIIDLNKAREAALNYNNQVAKVYGQNAAIIQEARNKGLGYITGAKTFNKVEGGAIDRFSNQPLIQPTKQSFNFAGAASFAKEGASAIAGSALTNIAVIGGATIALSVFMDQLGKFKTEVDATNKSIDESGLGFEKMQSGFVGMLKSTAGSLFANNQYDSGITKAQLDSGYAKIRGAQSKDLLEKSAKDLITLSDGSKKLIGSLDEIKQDEIVIALNKKKFNVGDVEAVKKLNEETTKLYNKQKSLIEFNKSMMDIRNQTGDPTSSIRVLSIQKSQLQNDLLNANNYVVKELQKNIALINASIEDINTANLKSTIKEIENYRFLRDNPEQLKKMQERGSALGDPTYIKAFTTEFNKLLANTSLTMSNTEKAALAWDIVNKNIQKTVDYGTKSTDVYLNLMKEAGKQDKDIFKMRSILELNKVMKSPSSTKTDKDLAKIQYESDILNFKKQDAISRGRRFGTTERLDYGTQAAFNAITEQKQKASDPVLKELKNINAQQVNELKLHTAFLAKLIEQGQKIK